MLDLEWYRSFVAIYRSGTVSGAAATRFLTQPAVSQHLAALEAAVGQPLFKRTPRRMVPTEQGKALYSQVAQALETLERVSREMQDRAASEKTLVRIGTPLEYFFEIALERLRGLPFRFSVALGLAQDLLERLERGELDGVIATQRLSTSGVEYSKLADERFILVGPPDKAPSDAADGSAEGLARVESWLAGLDWVSYGAELPIIRRFWQHSFRRRPEIRPALVIPNLHAIGKAVELGYGVSVLPEYLCRSALEAGRLHVLWTPSRPVANELWLAYRKVDRHDPAISRVRERLCPGEG